MSSPHATQDLGALSAHAPALAAVVAQVASDVALVIDAEGVIRSVAEGGAPLSASVAEWVGRRWVDTATPDTQRKLQLLLDEARLGGAARRREVNHPGPPGGNDIPVAWSAIRLGAQGPVVAVGRDLRAVAAIQQRFMAAQQDMERDYWRRRETEQRYQQLFHVASDAVIVLDAATHELLECNDAGRTLFPMAGNSSSRGSWPAHLPLLARAAVAELLVAASTSGRAAEIRVRALPDGGACAMSATPFRVGDRLQLLLRARREAGREDSAADAAGTSHGARLPHMAGHVETMPDAVVITDSSGRVQLANPAFVALVDAGDEAHLRGRALADLAGDAEGRWRALLERARLHGLAQAEPLHMLAGPVSTTVRANAALLTDGEQEAVGFVLQVLSPGAAKTPGATGGAALWAELAQVMDRIGEAPLETLLVDVARTAERHLLRRAWLASSGNRAEWAALLGQSTDELRARLHRLGLDECAEPLAAQGQGCATH